MNPRLFFGFEYRRVVLYTIAGILLVGHQSADIDWIQRVFIWSSDGSEWPQFMSDLLLPIGIILLNFINLQSE